MSTYEKELLVVVSSVQKWRPYLIGQTFVVRTDQQSLKLLGYDFRVEYKKGRKNKVTDALSRNDEALIDSTLATFSFPIATWLDDLRSSYLDDLTKEL